MSFSTAILIDFKVKFLQAESQVALPVPCMCCYRSYCPQFRLFASCSSTSVIPGDGGMMKTQLTRSPGILAKPVTKASAGKH